ncbi:MAG: hypothetical protein NTW52_17145 [Planctomycetota bacterium]|nr:hypothetical protein [Planctomycetota bacterium]
MMLSCSFCLSMRCGRLLTQSRLIVAWIWLATIGSSYPISRASEEPSEKSSLVTSEPLLPVTKSDSLDKGIPKPEKVNSVSASEEAISTTAPAMVMPATPLERWLHLEKAFVRRIVSLSDSQETLLASVTAEKANARKAPSGMRAPIDISRDKAKLKDDIRQLLSDGSPRTLDYRMAVRNLESAIAKVLTEEQLDTYQTEKTAREQFARDAGALGVTLLIDSKLKLSLNQIEILRNDLATWGGITTIPIEAYEASDSFLPGLKDSLVLKHLTPTQFNMYVGFRHVAIESESSTQNPLFDPVLITK